MSTAKKQKAIRTVTLNKIAGMTHVPQNTLRENYLGIVSMLVTSNPSGYTRTIPLDADQLNFFLNDKARSAEVIRTIAREDKEKEKAADDAGKKAKPEKVKKTEKGKEVPPEPPAPEEKAEKKPPSKTQSTLFDGF